MSISNHLEPIVRQIYLLHGSHIVSKSKVGYIIINLAKLLLYASLRITTSDLKAIKIVDLPTGKINNY